MKSTTEDTEGTERATPETDALILSKDGFGATRYEWAKHSSRLERERDEAREKYFAMRDLSNNATELAEKYKRERDEARKHLAAANKGAEINAHINNSLTAKLAEAKRERDELREKYDTLATEHMLEVNKLCNERDEAREDAHQLTQKRNELLAYLDAAHYATCNAELRRERDEARREVDRYREEKDLSPMSWDT